MGVGELGSAWTNSRAKGAEDTAAQRGTPYRRLRGRVRGLKVESEEVYRCGLALVLHSGEGGQAADFYLITVHLCIITVEPATDTHHINHFILEHHIQH